MGGPIIPYLVVDMYTTSYIYAVAAAAAVIVGPVHARLAKKAGNLVFVARVNPPITANKHARHPDQRSSDDASIRTCTTRTMWAATFMRDPIHIARASGKGVDVSLICKRPVSYLELNLSGGPVVSRFKGPQVRYNKKSRYIGHDGILNIYGTKGMDVGPGHEEEGGLRSTSLIFSGSFIALRRCAFQARDAQCALPLTHRDGPVGPLIERYGHQM